jgi:hypothetical protein
MVGDCEVDLHFVFRPLLFRVRGDRHHQPFFFLFHLELDVTDTHCGAAGITADFDAAGVDPRAH